MTLSPTVKDLIIDKFLAIQQWAWKGQVSAMVEPMDRNRIDRIANAIDMILAELDILIEGLKK